MNQLSLERKNQSNDNRFRAIILEFVAFSICYNFISFVLTKKKQNKENGERKAF